MLRRRNDMLYLIQSLNYYKIGYTSNLKSRMYAYKTMNPHAVLLGVKEGDRYDEAVYHDLYKEYQYYTEWFQLPKNLVQSLLTEFSAISEDEIKSPELKEQALPIKKSARQKILQWLLNAANDEGQVSLPAAKRQKMCSDLSITSNQVTNNLKKLKELGLITGEKGEFTINPEIFWKGNTKTRQQVLKGKSLKVSFELVEE